METIVLHIANNESEYARAVAKYQWKRGTIRNYAVFFGLFIIADLAYIFSQGMQDFWPSYLPILVTGAALGWKFYTNPGRWRKQFRADPRNAKPFTWEVSEQGLNVISETTQVRCDWRNFREALETEEFFFLVFAQDKKQFFFAPMRVFESEQQMEQFRALVKAKVG